MKLKHLDIILLLEQDLTLLFFEWEVDLTRIIARGNVCHNCNCHKIILEYPIIEGSHRENDPKKITNVELGSHEVISTHSGYDKK